MMRSLLGALLVLPFVASAQETRLVAVLPMEGANTTLQRSALVALEESIRTKAGDALRPLGYNVMTTESTLQILGDNGVDVAKACEASCALEAGREMKARYIIAGQATTNEGRHSVFIRFFDVNDGQLLSSLKLVGMDGRELEDAFDSTAAELFSKARLDGESAVPGTLVVGANVADADVSIDGRPQGQRVGPARSASFDVKPGMHQVKVSKAGYFEFISRVEVRPRERLNVTAELQEEKEAVEKATFKGGVTTLLTIDTEPRGALVRIDGRPVGRGPVSVRVAPGEHEIEALADLHLPASQKVSLQEGDLRKASLVLRPSFGRLEVTSRPGGALVFLDDRQLGAATPSLAIPRVASGTYRLRLTLADHYDHVETVTVRDGETTSVTPPALRASVGALRITSEPPGARVTIDGLERGQTPLVVEKLPGGVHELRLERAEYRDVVDTVTAREGAETTRAFTLEPAFALLSVDASPVRARVFVDGRAVGTTPLAGAHLPEGEALVRVEPEGESYRAWEKRVASVPGRPIRLNAELQAIRARLLVMTTPPGARVVLDGRVLGESPAVVPDLLAGRHSLEVSLFEHRTETRSIRVVGDQENVVEIQLVEMLPREKIARRVAAWEVESSAARRNAWLATLGTAALAGVTGWQYFETRKLTEEKAGRYAWYLEERDDPTVAWASYMAAHEAESTALTRTFAIGLATGVAAVGAGWLWWRVPAKPTFSVSGGGGELGLAGEW